MIFRVRADDPNRNVIVETITDDGRRTIMAQRYIPGIAQGDKQLRQWIKGDLTLQEEIRDKAMHAAQQ